MPISAERRAQIQQMLQQAPQQAAPTTAPATGGMTAERRAQINAMLQQPQATQGVQTSPQPTQTQPGGFQSFVQGIAKPFARLGSSVAGIAEGAVDLARGDVSGARDALTRERDLGYFGQVRPIGINEQGEQMSTGGTIKDVAGTAAELGSYLIPGAGALKGVKSVATGGIRALPRVALDQGILGGASGLLGGAGIEAQKEDSTAGSILGEGLKGGAAGAAIGAALPVAGAAVRSVARPVGNAIGRVGAEVLGKSTGAGETAIREAFSNPSVINLARGKGGTVEELMTGALDDARAGLSNLRKVRGDEYVSQLEKIKLNKSQLDNIIESARSRAKDAASELGIKFKDGQLLNNLDFADSTIERAQGTVQKSFNDVMRWTDVTPAGLDKLKKKLDQHLDEIPVTERGGAFNFVLQLKNSVSDGLKENVPGYEQMTSRYGEASDLINEVQRALSLKDTVSKDTAIRKLMSTMRQNNELRKEMLATVGKAGGKDPLAKIAGATLMSKTPRGLAGTLQPTAIGVAGFTTPASIPGLILYLAATSPRLVAELVALLGKVKGKVIPPVIQTQIRNLLIRAANEDTSESAVQDSPIRTQQE